MENYNLDAEIAIKNMTERYLELSQKYFSEIVSMQTIIEMQDKEIKGIKEELARLTEEKTKK